MDIFGIPDPDPHKNLCVSEILILLLLFNLLQFAPTIVKYFLQTLFKKWSAENCRVSRSLLLRSANSGSCFFCGKNYNLGGKYVICYVFLLLKKLLRLNKISYKG